ncbi:GAF domain-containing protein [Pseudonocardia sediminis]|uniref:GAF domain-containing protein n=1 Tax=Pseudonocardia sediminis TaxID=1397368 RepID=A0A4Q7V061_PSEST|nr:GAF and ANTAR domain-containing protein [Pseudonocardia sediminis]RZT87822.1 GAF domain-containing protein [Pseudonocardia sediminis]
MATPHDPSPDRSAVLTEAFIRLTDVLAPGYDAATAPDHLARSCRELLLADAVGVLLAGTDGHLAVAAASPETPPTTAMFGLDRTTGPGHRAFVTGRPVTVAALEGPTPWPQFCAAAQRNGYRTAYSSPLRQRTDRIGALTLLSAGPVPISDTDVTLVRALTTMATIGILTARAYRTQTDLSEQLQSALSSRIAIEQAKGLVAAHNSGDLEAAFVAIRTTARNNSVRLRDVADAIINGELSAREMVRREPEH